MLCPRNMGAGISNNEREDYFSYASRRKHFGDDSAKQHRPQNVTPPRFYSQLPDDSAKRLISQYETISGSSEALVKAAKSTKRFRECGGQTLWSFNDQSDEGRFCAVAFVSSSSVLMEICTEAGARRININNRTTFRL